MSNSLYSSGEEMGSETIFEKIIKKEIPADIVYEDEFSLAFRDISPQAPVHILIIPKKHIAKISEASEEDKELLGHLLLVSQKIAEDMKLSENGFRLVINNGEKAGQAVFHLHIHLMGGREFTWPPG